MKKESLLIISCFIFSLLGITTHAQKVSNITFRQEQSNIIVSYDLETKTPCKISLFVSTDDGKTWKGPLKKVTGDVGAKITTGNHSITWNVLEEFEELRGDKIKFQVKADETKSQTIASINQAIIKNPKDAKLFKLRGDLKKEVNDRKGAIADYTKAILLNPKYADAYKARGFQRYIDDEAEAALSDINKAISLNPNDALTFYYRADLKNSLKDYNGAIFDYTKALELEPNNTQFLIQRANLKFELKDFVGSIDDCNKVIEFDSTSKWDRNYFERRILKSIYWFRGINKYNLNDIEGANSDFEKHFKLKLIPKHIGYIEIGSWRFNNNDYKSAIDHFTKSIDLLPETLVDSLEEREAYLGRAFSKYMLKNEIGAAVDFNKYIEKSQNKSRANYLISIGFNTGYFGKHFRFGELEIKNFKEVIYYLTKAIELDRYGAALYFQKRAEAKKELKEYRGAIEDYTKAIELVPRDDVLYTHRAITKENLEDYRGAIEDYTKAIELDLDHRSYYYSNRASAKEELEDYRGAIEDYTKAIELEPESYYYNYRGGCKFNINNYIGAIADYTKAIQLNPKDGNSYLNRGRLKLLTKDKKGGCKDLSKAGELGEDDAYEYINENCN